MKYDFDKRSKANQYFCDPISLVKPEFKDQCDINKILKKYAKNGVNPFVLTADAKFGDFTDVPSYKDAYDLIISAGDRFDQLPAPLRKRFHNDPGQLLTFLENPSNRDEAIDLGLVDRPVPPVSVPTPISAVADTKTEATK